MTLTIAQMTELDGGVGPNAMRIRAGGSKVIEGKIPTVVRRELMDAVKMGKLGRLPKKGLLPEVFYHPDHKHGAIERQKAEAVYAISCIAKVIAPMDDNILAIKLAR